MQTAEATKQQTRIIRVDGGFTAEVNLIRIDKRGALVEVPSREWFVYKGKYRSHSTNTRFYVPVNQARKARGRQ